MNPQTELNKAAISLEQKDYKKAIKHATAVLTSESGSAHAMFIFAIASAHLNHKKNALETFNKLITTVPENSEIHYNHGVVLSLFELDSKAIQAFKKAINLHPKHVFAYINLGNIYSQNNQLELAINAYENAHNLNPKDTGLLDNLSKAYFKANAFEKSLFYLHKIKAIQQLDDKQNVLVIQCYIQLGNYREADRRSLTLADQKSELIWGHYYHGLCSQKLSRYPVAIEAYQQVIKIDQHHLDTLKNLAICYNYIADYQTSNETLETIKTHTDDSLDTKIFEFTLKEMNNELNVDNDLFLALHQDHPENPDLFILHSKVLIKSKDYQAAVLQLSQPPKSIPLALKAESLFLLAGVYDKTQQYDLAWQTYQKANDMLPDAGSDPFNEKLKRLIPQLKHIKESPINQASEQTTDVVFVLGFPRSGTTLIDSILSSQNDAIVLEETPLIADLAEQIMGEQPFEKYVDSINSLSATTLEQLKKDYFSKVPLYHNWQPHQTVIDKSPLNLVHALLIHRIFPTAPIIFAVRHPLDVCISCFTQNFRANPELKSAFASIQSVKNTYVNLMTVWQQTEEKISLHKMTVNYEGLISQTEKVMKQMVEFAGFAWTENYLNFQQGIKDRGMIHNPSYNQVNQKIYTSKVFRYKNYQPQLASIKPDLEPWIETYNYPSE